MEKNSKKILVSKVNATKNLKSDIEKSVNLIGGFEKFVKKGESVLIKPNFVFDAPYPAISDPKFVRAVAELCFEAGAKEVVVGESSVMYSNTKKIYENQGLYKELEGTEIKVVDFDDEKFEHVKSGGKHWNNVFFAQRGLNSDCIIYLPCLKTHYLADFTMSLKLTDGFTKKLTRVWQHAGNLRQKMVDLNLIIKPRLIILDGRKCFITKGPAEGLIRAPNLILASDDRIALDVEGIKIIQGFPGNTLAGKNPWELGQIKYAVEKNLGAKSEQDYRVVE